jgi:RNA polymerase sigma factor (sigma-70 family)
MRNRRLTLAEAKEMVVWYETANRLRNHIYVANLGLVYKMGYRMRIRDYPEGDLWTSDASISLLRCVDKFNVSRGYKFSTYACRAIIKEYYRKIKKNANRAFNIMNDGELPLEVEDHRLRDEQNLRADIQELKTILHKNIARLTLQERKVISRRFRDNPMTLGDVGKEIALTKERIRQIQVKALKKLKQAFLSENAYRN